VWSLLEKLEAFGLGFKYLPRCENALVLNSNLVISSFIQHLTPSLGKVVLATG
jgi:hypothetical protein